MNAPLISVLRYFNGGACLYRQLVILTESIELDKGMRQNDFLRNNQKNDAFLLDVSVIGNSLIAFGFVFGHYGEPL